MYKCIYIYTYIHIYVYTYLACTCMYIYIYIHIYNYIYILAYRSSAILQGSHGFPGALRHLRPVRCQLGRPCAWRWGQTALEGATLGHLGMSRNRCLKLPYSSCSLYLLYVSYLSYSSHSIYPYHLISSHLIQSNLIYFSICWMIDGGVLK